MARLVVVMVVVALHAMLDDEALAAVEGQIQQPEQHDR